MRSLVFAAVLFIASPVASAQLVEGYGVRAGVAFTGVSTGIQEFSGRTGFLVGAYGMFGLLPDVSLVTELEYARRGYEYAPFRQDSPEMRALSGTSYIDMVSVPVWVKIRTGVTRTLDAYVGGGPRADFIVNVNPAEVTTPDGEVVVDPLGPVIEADVSFGMMVIGGFTVRDLLPLETRVEIRFTQGISDLTPEFPHDSVQYRSVDLSLSFAF